MVILCLTLNPTLTLGGGKSRILRLSMISSAFHLTNGCSWDDDVVFKNQARGTEDKHKKEFVNVCGFVLIEAFLPALMMAI